MSKSISSDYQQEYFENKILDYQKAMEEKRYEDANDIYKKICEIYNPEKYVSIWQRQYQYLYDSKEDFVQDYMGIFVKTLRKWKPREERSESRYHGAGTFKNYFWGSLSHNYINMVKSAEGAAKRNFTTRCPECGDWVNPISTHIIKHHADILWKKLKSDGVDVDTIKSCPFCNNSIYKGKSSSKESDVVKKHILSKHLYMLFEVFSEKHPSVHSGSVKHISADITTDSAEDDFSIYDVTPAPTSLIDKIVSSNLTTVQNMIIENIISKKTHNLKWSKSVYKCTQEEFDEALNGLREKIILLEDSIGRKY